MSWRGFIQLVDSGFCVLSFEDEGDTMLWSEVRRINAGLKDLLTTDVVYFHFFSDRSEAPILVTEEMDGFRIFERAVFRSWPEIETPWRAVFSRRSHRVHYGTIWERGHKINS